MRVLVIGGTGGFGALLVEGLVRHTAFAVTIAARNGARAEALAARLRAAHPGRDIAALALDAREVTPAMLKATGAAVLVDAAGPWQGAEYRLPRAAIAAGMHAIDLADARGYVAGFGPALDAEARAAGVLALTGASSTPALSNAALDRMLRGWRQVDVIEVAISPGNRAPRGPSVVAAILSYAGRPVRVFRDGAWTWQPGWGLTVRRRIALDWRLVGLCETPDLDILPARFGVRRTALFRAGLELPLLHRGLWLASLAVRLGLLRSLRPFAGPARWIAERFRHCGSDRGGMRVEARGLDAEGRTMRACWILSAAGGDGPVIPILPALAALRALADGRLAGRSGALPCVGLLLLRDIAREFAPYRIACHTRRSPQRPLFESALGKDAFQALPAPIRRLHSPGWWLRASGMAEVTAPQRLGWLAARLIGVPRRAGPVPVAVTFERTLESERWTRDFGGRRFASELALRSQPGKAALCERFGPLAFDLALPSDGAGLRMVVTGWRLFRLPMPRMLAPVSLASETMDAAGRFRFDVEIRLPLGLGRVVRYRGWLVPEP